MRAVLIINPISGDTVPNAEKVPGIKELLDTGPYQTEVRFTTEEITASHLAREAVAQGFDAVFVGGGDGTVSEVARELVHTPATLGVLPIGTFNNIARSLGIPTDLAEACAIINRGNIREIDVGVANDDHYFFEAAGAGLDATLFPLGEEIKGGRWSRVFEAFKLTFQYEPQPVELTFDRPLSEVVPAERKRRYSPHALRRRSVRRRALLVVVANGPYYGGGYTVSPGARMSDGQLTISIYRNFSKLELAKHFWSISHGRYHYSPKIETYTASRVLLESPSALPVHVDGLPFGHTPMTLRAAPRALRVLASERPAPPSKKDAAVALPVAEESAEPARA